MPVCLVGSVPERLDEGVGVCTAEGTPSSGAPIYPSKPRHAVARHPAPSGGAVISIEPSISIASAAGLLAVRSRLLRGPEGSIPHGSRPILPCVHPIVSTMLHDSV